MKVFDIRYFRYQQNENRQARLVWLGGNKPTASRVRQPLFLHRRASTPLSTRAIMG